MNAGVAVVQVTGRVGERDYNLELVAGAADQAMSQGADIVVLPELISSGYTADPNVLRSVSEGLDGPSVESWGLLARQHRGYVVGGFCEAPDGPDGPLFNSTVIVGPDGVELHYRKLHLFDREKLAFEPGDLGLPVAELPFGRVGMCVCYDLRFVEVLRALSLQDADLVCVPTAWLAGFDQVKWDEHGLAPQANGAILQANLDQVYVACASQAGTEDGPNFLGSSILVGPRGELIAGPLSGDKHEVAVAEVDLADAQRAQTRGERITPRADRRTDVYGLAIGGRIL